MMRKLKISYYKLRNTLFNPYQLIMTKRAHMEDNQFIIVEVLNSIDSYYDRTRYIHNGVILYASDRMYFKKKSCCQTISEMRLYDVDHRLMIGKIKVSTKWGNQ